VQRLNAMQFAADIWGAVLESPVEIRIGASFSTLACSSTSAVIGETGPNSVHRDFAGAPVASDAAERNEAGPPGRFKGRAD